MTDREAAVLHALNRRPGEWATVATIAEQLEQDGVVGMFPSYGAIRRILGRLVDRNVIEQTYWPSTASGDWRYHYRTRT
jgi:predicted transcriptional regulator